MLYANTSFSIQSIFINRIYTINKTTKKISKHFIAVINGNKSYVNEKGK